MSKKILHIPSGLKLLIKEFLSNILQWESNGQITLFGVDYYNRVAQKIWGRKIKCLRKC